ncbi:hypothetical protein BJ878DRAFT_477334 [Calycina marina]|uniref:Glucose-methanol-choline oxidoreductase N-terminal domain-containing protein n=1 Tax=Calycina marina TaxID=1763456 RepID=A0A9P8CI36_9HELO|nr:hypothetical protein BJ878DRAFT_477334 [Calycina marina]
MAQQANMIDGRSSELQAGISRICCPISESRKCLLGRMGVSKPHWCADRAWCKILKVSMGRDSAGGYWFTITKDPKDESTSSFESFYGPFGRRENLHLLFSHQVAKVLLKTSKGGSTKATGIEYSSGLNETRLTVMRLQISGIGDRRRLNEVGIKTIADLPGVGTNYQDHLMFIDDTDCQQCGDP